MVGARTPTSTTASESYHMQTEIAPGSKLVKPIIPVHERKVVNGSFRAENILGLPVTDKTWSAIITITPEMAHALLETMPQQRELRPGMVSRYAAAMQEGQWQVSHQGIAFNVHGKLIDGQHRLKAAASIGHDLTTMATFCVSNRAFEVVDRSVRRTVADDVHTRGIGGGDYSKTLATAAQVIRAVDLGFSPGGYKSTNPLLKPLTASDVEAIVERHPLLAHTNKWVNEHRMVKPKPPIGSLVAFVALFREVDEDNARKFAAQVMTGEGLAQGDSALVIREALSADMKGNGSPNSRLAFMYRLVRGWNAFLSKRKVVSLVSTEWKNSGFPKISGYKYR